MLVVTKGRGLLLRWNTCPRNTAYFCSIQSPRFMFIPFGEYNLHCAMFLDSKKRKPKQSVVWCLRCCQFRGETGAASLTSTQVAILGMVAAAPGWPIQWRSTTYRIRLASSPQAAVVQALPSSGHRFRNRANQRVRTTLMVISSSSTMVCRCLRL